MERLEFGSGGKRKLGVERLKKRHGKYYTGNDFPSLLPLGMAPFESLVSNHSRPRKPDIRSAKVEELRATKSSSIPLRTTIAYHSKNVSEVAADDRDNFPKPWS